MYQSSQWQHSYQIPSKMLSNSIFNPVRLDILTVGTYSEGNLFVVYEIKRQV